MIGILCDISWKWQSKSVSGTLAALKGKVQISTLTNIWGRGIVANLQVFLWGLGPLLVLVILEGPKIQIMVMDINTYEILKNLIDKRTVKKTHHFSSLVQLRTGQRRLCK